MKTKRIVAIILGVLLMGAMMTSASAAAADSGIMPLFDYTVEIRASFSLSGNVATVEGLIKPAGSYRSTVVVRLQYREPGTSTWIADSDAIWQGSNSSGTSAAGGTYTLKRTGKDYRVRVTGRVFDSNGVLLEKLDKYSSIKHY